VRKAKVPLDVIQTLFGPEKLTYHCNTCGRKKAASGFYCVTNTNKPRSQCKKCWGIFNGRSPIFNHEEN
jgi:hypothetical protein